MTTTTTIRYSFTLTDASTSVTLDSSLMLNNITKARLKNLSYTNPASDRVMTICIDELNINLYSDGGNNLYRNFATIHLPASGSTVYYTANGSDTWDWFFNARPGQKPKTLNSLNIDIRLDHLRNSASIDASNPVYLVLEFETQ